MNVTVTPVELSANGEAGDAVTPEGRPERLTVTVPENPFCDCNVSPIVAVEFADIDKEAALAPIVNEGEGGGGGALIREPPPQP